MKVLIITPSPPQYLGGLALFSKDLSLHLEKNGIKVDMLTSTLSKEGPIFEKMGENINVFKQKVYLFPDNNNILRIKNPLFFIFNFLKKKAKKYDIIHVHSYIYFSTIQTFLFNLLLNRTRPKLPIVLHLHGGIRTGDFVVSNFIEKLMLLFKKYIFDIILGKFIIKKADAAISVSKDDLLAINKVFKINRKNHNYYLPNVVDSERFQRLPEFKRKYIGFIGRLTKIKGLDLFLELIERFNKIDKNQEFLIIGQGPYIYNVKEAMKVYPIKFLEKVSHNDMVKYYNECSIFVQTSRAEGLPTCILEALSCEVPVVASNVGGTNEIVLNGKTGYLFENGKIEEAINFINKINKNKEIDTLGKNGRELIKHKYSWEAITKNIIQIYEKLLKKNIVY